MGSLERLRVLLVDDEPEILRALTLELSDFAEVTSALTVAEALAIVDTNRFDVVVADLRLPDQWGDELLAHVAARFPTTRRVLLTGDESPESTMRELLDVGVIDACYRKLAAEELVEALRAQGKHGSMSP